MLTVKTSLSLSVSRYRVTFVAREPLDLPSYLGSTLRGAFGHAFRTVACPAVGGKCPIPNQCPYHLIFETSPPPRAAALRTHEDIPRPFVIAPARRQPIPAARRQRFESGDKLFFDLVLIGRAQEFFPYFVVALREITKIGRGANLVELDRIEALPGIWQDSESSSPMDCKAADREPLSPRSFNDKRVEVERCSVGQKLTSAPCGQNLGISHQIVYDATDNLVRGAAPSTTLEEYAALVAPSGPVTIEFLTQTRLKHAGRFIRHPEFQVVFRRLLGRLSSLARFHCGTPLDIDFRGLIDEAASIQLVRNQTRWTKWERYSSRQDRRMEWEGIIGPATYKGDFAPFWKFLKFGELVHVGHGATFGLGQYRISV